MRRLVKSGDFTKFDALAFKLLVYFSQKRNAKDLTPWTTIEELSTLAGAGWRKTKRALTRLLEFGVIRQETQRRSTRFCLVFKDPYAHAQEQDTQGQTHLRSTNADAWGDGTATAPATKADVHVYASVEGRSRSSKYAETADNPARFGTQRCPKRQASQDGDPAWLTEHDEPEYPAGYTAGEDVDSIAQGRTQ